MLAWKVTGAGDTRSGIHSAQVWGMNGIYFKYKYTGSTGTCLLVCDDHGMSPGTEWIHSPLDDKCSESRNFVCLIHWCLA